MDKLGENFYFAIIITKNIIGSLDRNVKYSVLNENFIALALQCFDFDSLDKPWLDFEIGAIKKTYLKTYLTIESKEV